MHKDHQMPLSFNFRRDLEAGTGLALMSIGLSRVRVLVPNFCPFFHLITLTFVAQLLSCVNIGKRKHFKLLTSYYRTGCSYFFNYHCRPRTYTYSFVSGNASQTGSLPVAEHLGDFEAAKSTSCYT